MSFTTCKRCGKQWLSREGFLADARVILSGCHVETGHPAASALLFDHREAGCGTTLAMPLRHFGDLHSGARHKVNWATSKMCPGMCFDPHNTQPCDKECACAYVRAILQEVSKLSGTA